MHSEFCDPAPEVQPPSLSKSLRAVGELLAKRKAIEAQRLEAARRAGVLSGLAAAAALINMSKDRIGTDAHDYLIAELRATVERLSKPGEAQ
jgi:hypothetical protein